MKTPEEIKKGLAIHIGECPQAICKRCPYNCELCREPGQCIDDMTSDALAYIRQLEANLERVTRERDAAIADLKELSERHSYSTCSFCKHNVDDEYVSNDCFDCVAGGNWQWRGVEVENGRNH